MSTPSNPILTKDGASQNRRLLPMLDPSYAPVDERSLEDLLRFTREFAKGLRYYTEDGLPNGNWEGFLSENYALERQLTPAQRNQERDKWVRQILRYVEAPDKWEGPKERLDKLSQPHLALFLSFLKLLHHIRTQLNGIGGRHLDYYYRKALQMTHREALPDLVHVVLELTDGVDAHALPAGTLLSAGTDSTGKDLVYRTDEETLITRGAVAEQRTAFVDQEHIGVAAFHALHRESATQGFEEMWRIPLGVRPGDPMPYFGFPGEALRPFTEALFLELDTFQTSLESGIGIDADSFVWLHELAQGGTVPKNQEWNRVLKILPAGAENTVLFIGWVLSRDTFGADFLGAVGKAELSSAYARLKAISQYFFLSHASIRSIAALRRKEQEIFEEDDKLLSWATIYPILDEAYRKRTIRDRQLALARYRQEAVLRSPGNGFDELLAFAAGELKEPDGYRLPPYGSEPGILTELETHLNSSNQEEKNQAYLYILENLRIEPRDFQRLLTIRAQADPSPADWGFVYEVLEKSQRSRDGYVLAAPVKVEWKNVYVFPDATQNLSKPDVGIEENDPRWKTFGAPQRGSNAAAQTGQLGFAVASPLLDLREGERQISLVLNFTKGSFDQAALESVLGDQSPLHPIFRFALSSEKEWVNPRATEIVVGSFLVEGAGERVDDRYRHNPDGTLSALQGATFTNNDRGALIVLPDGNVYTVDEIRAPDLVSILPEGTKVLNPSGMRRVSPAELLPNAIRFTLTLSAQDPAIGMPGEELEGAAISQGLPLLRMVLSDIPDPVPGSTEVRFKKVYQPFQGLTLEKVFLHTQVERLQTLVVQNELEVIAPEKPFQPFGLAPEPGSSLYFTHPELASKRLDSLRIRLDWMNPPAQLGEFYAGYDKILAGNPDLPPANYRIQSNADVVGQLRLHDRRLPLDLGTHALFATDDANLPLTIELPALSHTTQVNQFAYTELPIEDPEKEEALHWPRYFSLALGPVDFRHDEYSELLVKQALNSDPEREPYLAEVTLKDAYTPTLRSIQLDYAAGALLPAQPGTNARAGRFFHLHPFGYTAAANLEGTPLLPQYNQEGSLYIGMRDLQPGSVVPLLFQMAEGSANPDLPKAAVKWDYLHGDNWQPFAEADIVSDSTGGLLKSGILKVRVPDLADTDHRVLPGALYWFRATVDMHTDSVSDVVRILAQAVRATFWDQDNAEDHLNSPLSPNTIAGAVEPIAEVGEITQPFPSTGGKPKESDKAFFTRIGERLRHKRRAVTMWDYERLVLERFPDIHKVKCLSSDYENPEEEPGLVRMIVIPDIIGRFPFNPYQPKVPAEKLVEIREYMEALMPPFAKLEVKNPRYLQVNVRVAVKLREGYSEGYYRAKLEDDLRRYLAPWAYKEGRDIVFGGKLYANVIVDYIERRPYVDYIGRINLFQSQDGKNFLDARLFNGGENMVTANAPDIVLVSALHHHVELIREGEFQEDLLQGIGNAHIEVDFYVSEDPITQS